MKASKLIFGALILTFGSAVNAAIIEINPNLLGISDPQINNLSSGRQGWEIGLNILNENGVSVEPFPVNVGDVVRITTLISNYRVLELTGESTTGDFFRGGADRI